MQFYLVVVGSTLVLVLYLLQLAGVKVPTRVIDVLVIGVLILSVLHLGAKARRFERR
jgi:hypothetical protein